MTKSRTARAARAALAVLAALLVASPMAAPAAEPEPMTAEQAIAAHRERIAAVIRGRRGACRDVAAADEIVVCGRADDSSMRVPYEPVPGERRAIAGDIASGGAAMEAGGCLRLCPQPVMIDVIGAVRALERGLDRILHPD